MVDGTGTTTYAYNAITGSVTTGAGRLYTVTLPMASSTAVVAYGYDELGRVTSRTVDGGSTVSTTFDTLGRVTGVTNALGAFTYAYVNTTSRLSGVTYPSGTGLSTSYSYFNNAGDQRLQTIQNFKSSGTVTVSKFDYTYNAVGTIGTWTTQADSSTAVVNTLTYDKADQLTNCTQSGGGSASNAYVYDPAGNRLAETTASGTTGGQFNKLNQLVGIGTGTSTTVAGYVSSAVTNVVVNAIPASLSGGTNFTASVPLPPSGTNDVVVVAQDSSGDTKTQRVRLVNSGAPTALTYDANGNTLTDENGNSYQWDALNRLTQITYPSTAYTTFAYDGLSRRTQIAEYNSSHTLTSTKNYLWIGSEIAEERNASNVVQKRFFPQGEQQSGTAYYYTRDHLGSVREMCSSTGTITSRMAYDPYGRTTTVSGTILPTKQYTGDYCHSTSGLELTKYRAYDPNAGRWLSRDPLGETADYNLYSYVKNHSLTFSDPTGLYGGTFDFTTVDRNWDNTFVQISYTQDGALSRFTNGACCKHVKFIQIARGQGPNGYDPNWSVDYAPTKKDPAEQHYPYYPWSSSPANGEGGMADRPGTGGLNGWGFWQEFETCAVCDDTGKVLGCTRWGHGFGPFGRAWDYGMNMGQKAAPPTWDFTHVTGYH